MSTPAGSSSSASAIPPSSSKKKTPNKKPDQPAKVPAPDQLTPLNEEFSANVVEAKRVLSMMNCDTQTTISVLRNDVQPVISAMGLSTQTNRFDFFKTDGVFYVVYWLDPQEDGSRVFVVCKWQLLFMDVKPVEGEEQPAGSFNRILKGWKRLPDGTHEEIEGIYVVSVLKSS